VLTCVEIDLGEEKKNLDKLNLVVVKKCADELLCISNDEDFLINNRTPSEIREIYNLSENDYVEVMDHIKSTLFEHR
jgi:ADP-glucose pyrophosphorylase